MRSTCYVGLLQRRGGVRMPRFTLSVVFLLLIPAGARTRAESKGWMRPGGLRAHSTGGRDHLQPLVYCSQHPIPWQGTIPEAPMVASPGRGVHSTHQHLPQPPAVPQGGWERVKDPLAGAIVSDTMERKRTEIPPAPTGQMDGAGQTDVREGEGGLTLPGTSRGCSRAAGGRGEGVFKAHSAAPTCGTGTGVRDKVE